MADQLYRQGVRDDVELRELLSITAETLKTYLADAKRDEKEAAKSKAWDLWLDCHSYREIEKLTGVDQATAERWVVSKTDESENETPPASRQHFDIWCGEKTDSSDNSPPVSRRRANQGYRIDTWIEYGLR